MRHSKRRSLKKNKKTVRRGGSYGFAGAIAPGAANWARGSEYGPYVAGVADRGGNMQYGRGRKRKNKKKTMRGGNKYGAVSAGYTGTGVRGMANYTQENTKYPPFGSAKGGEFNNAGAGPGNFKGFAGLLPK
jgi:hypothetical protein